MMQLPLNNDTRFEVSEERLKVVLQKIAFDHGYVAGEVSLAIIDDPTMHTLNREHLEHDYPTDVLSFVLEADAGRLEGEIIVSSDTAQREAPVYGWEPESELLLYFIHGMLHLVGYDDHDPELREKMRDRESHYLQSIEIQTPQARSSAETLASKGDGPA